MSETTEQAELTTRQEYDARLVATRGSIEAHAEKVTAKRYDQITATELETVGPPNKGARTRGEFARRVQNKKRIEKAAMMRQFISDRFAAWEAAGRPADQVIYDSDGNISLRPEGGL